MEGSWPAVWPCPPDHDHDLSIEWKIKLRRWTNIGPLWRTKFLLNKARQFSLYPDYFQNMQVLFKLCWALTSWFLAKFSIAICQNYSHIRWDNLACTQIIFNIHESFSNFAELSEPHFLSKFQYQYAEMFVRTRAIKSSAVAGARLVWFKLSENW